MVDSTTVFDLLRHGEPEGGPMYRGSKDDPLSDTGWAQMRGAITGADRWDAVLTSPMLRCAHFARELANRLQTPLHTDERLREISFGEWEGRTADEVMASDGEKLSQFWANPVTNTPPGGERVTDFNERVVECWHHWQQALAGQNILIVCHGGVIRMIVADAMNIPLEHAFSGLTTPYACRSRIQVNTSVHGRFQSLVAHGVFTALNP
ncbi:histidine phosphatase family protein [Marinobacter sp. 1_MG-2023]|uniref:histidine phosphatase family protein n=1 Tax=Marinobacter sp. 1_MG-2023 TaxID=3062627 RepID=UPI0026E2E5DA|nr:alpha-ribazole phosphatase family protein [Marinobacter sp. 1_MG-2023]MDO6824341.1 alpha-ribazole phosphatase family protein [Marinobacter sp. 1_MG-2023]